MAFTGTATVGAGSAGLVFHASGAGFGIFSSFSAFLAESAHYGPGSFVSTGSSSLELDSMFGNVTFTGSDTISVINGQTSFSGSSGVTFSIGGNTIPLLSSHTGSTAVSSAAATSQLNSFFSNAVAGGTFGGASAFGATHFLVPTSAPTVAGAVALSPVGAATQTLSDKSTITILNILKPT